MRQDGRIKFYRIGTRVLFGDEHLREFLASVEHIAAKKAPLEQLDSKKRSGAPVSTVETLGSERARG